MAAEWVPGVLAGTLASFVGNGLVLWKGAAVQRVQVAQLKKEIQRVDALRVEDRKAAKEFQENIEGELRNVVDSFHVFVRDNSGVAGSQAAFNQMVTKTLEGLVSKFERHDDAIGKNNTDIAVLKALNGGDAK